MFTKTFSWNNSQLRSPAYFFGKVRKGLNDVLLESCRTGKNGRFSYIAIEPETVIKSKDEWTIVNGIYQKTDTIDIIKEELRKCEQIKPEGFPLFYGGAIGYLGYDLKNLIEPRLKTEAERDINFWDCYMVIPKVVIGFDNVENKIFLSVKENSHVDIEKLEEILGGEKQKHDIPKKYNQRNLNLTTNLSFEQYKVLFNRAKDYVYSGDSYQIKISMRHELDALFDPWEIYKKLRTTNPSPYAAFLDLEEMALVSCSPEQLIKLDGRIAETRPIGGTYRRGKNDKEDLEVAKSFFEDEKEVSEHVMLIDLERNDLGRVCDEGSVQVIEKMALEKYTNLMHIVTTIRGNLSRDKTSFDLVKSMFPGGTVTGCPKIRTMEIIDELEPVARGVYTGSIGFITPSDECQFNIIIRTLVIDKVNKKGYIQVGGGIVAESNAEYEYQENLRKGKAIVDILYS